ncbi:MAG TPA: amino acid ABC transporter permease [Acidimicrobiales bacterium]|nr:amino acid ABC transporter permease [Acidimicrobiales bacterium]
MTVALFDEVGPRGRRRVLVGTVVAGTVLLAVVVVAFGRFSSRGQLDADLWSILVDPGVVRYLLGGLANTLKAAAAGMVGATALGAVMALGRLSRRRPLRWLAGLYVEFFRGFPLLLLILFSAFGLPRLGVRFPLFWYLVLGLAVYNSAVLAEIFRAGILSLDRGQKEAAAAIGLRHNQAMLLVILPQALRRMMPAIISQQATLLKDTSLGFFVQYEELLRRAQITGSFDGNLLQALIAVAGVYIVVIFALSRLAQRLEVRQRRRFGGTIDITGGPEDLVAVETEGAARA